MEDEFIQHGQFCWVMNPLGPAGWALPMENLTVTLKPKGGRLLVIVYGQGNDGYVLSADRRVDWSQLDPGMLDGPVKVVGLGRMEGGLFREAVVEAWSILEGDKRAKSLRRWLKDESKKAE